MAEKPTISTPSLDVKTPGIKVPPPPKINQPTDIISKPVPKKQGITPPKTNIVGNSPDTKKDPTKQIEQLKNAEMLKTTCNGQWALVKDGEPHYHIHIEGERITHKPLPHSEIVSKYGSVQNLESQGYRLHEATVEKKAPEGVDPEKHERCVMDVKEQGHDVGSAHAICSDAMKSDDYDLPESCPSCEKDPGKPQFKAKNEIGVWWDCPKCGTTGLARPKKDLSKSNYGPKGMGQYTPTDNMKRKKTRTGEEYADIGQNKAARQYTTSATSTQQAHEVAEQKRQRKKTKASTKTLKDFSPEQIKAMEDAANTKKSEDIDLEKAKNTALREVLIKFLDSVRKYTDNNE